MIYKLLLPPEWRVLLAEGQIAGAPVDLADGFIHFSTAQQIDETAQKHFRGHATLILVACAAGALGGALRWEPSRGGALFPHFYAPLMRGQIAWWARIVSPQSDGRFLWPRGLIPNTPPLA